MAPTNKSSFAFEMSYKAGIDAEAAEKITTDSEVEREGEGNSGNRIAISAYHMAAAQAKDPSALRAICQELQAYGVAQETIGYLYYLRFMATSESWALDKALVHMQAAVNDADDEHPDLPRRQQSLAVVRGMQRFRLLQGITCFV